MEHRIGTRLKDRPEFYNKPKPVTFLKNDKVIDAISIMAKNNFGSVVVTLGVSTTTSFFTSSTTTFAVVLFSLGEGFEVVVVTLRVRLLRGVVTFFVVDAVGID